MNLIYVATFHGDLDHPPMVGLSLDGLLNDIMHAHGYGEEDERFEYNGETVQTWITPDPEDDKIEIWSTILTCALPC